MIILLNKYKYIESYATIGGIKEGVEIDATKKNIDMDRVLDYQYINGELIFNPIPYDSKPFGANMQYTGKEWKDEGTAQEKQTFYKQKMIETNNKIKELQEIGLGGGADEAKLKLELENYRKLYMDSIHEEALKENQNRL